MSMLIWPIPCLRPGRIKRRMGCIICGGNYLALLLVLVLVLMLMLMLLLLVAIGRPLQGRHRAGDDKRVGKTGCFG
jgi:uncharacterized membrane protein